ncbi:MAG: hypothetical protein ABFS86_06090 [Planctomycetota bacterium]
MRKRWTLLAVFVAVFALGGAIGIAADRYYVGAIPSNLISEEFKMSVGVSTSGSPSRANWIHQNREVLNVPEHYGRLVTINSDRETALLWYQDDNGRIRNVVIEQPADTWYMIDHQKTTELKLTRRK